MQFLRSEALALAVLQLALKMPLLTACMPQRFAQSRTTVTLKSTVSSDVITETNVASVPDCLLGCRMRGCAVAVLRLSSRSCQLVVINDASQTPGPAESHVTRVLGGETGDSVWTADNLDELVRTRSYSVSMEFSSSGSGHNGSVQQLQIRLTGCYRIEARGARGGSNPVGGRVGGAGATAAGNFSLMAGSLMLIVVGQAGVNATAVGAAPGGGGGSFVFHDDPVSGQRVLLVAAGGGGGCVQTANGLPGEGGLNGGNSSGSQAILMGFGGVNGGSGFNQPSLTAARANHGGCGAGWLGKAVNPRRSANDGERGGSRADGWVGGSGGDLGGGDGGFGGGGGGGGNGASLKGAPGAGGGYSGGGAGLGHGQAAGGGGSACIGGSGCITVTGGNADSEQGSASVRLLSAAPAC